MAPVCVLVGAPGCRQDQTGQALADRARRRRSADTDADIEATAGKPIPEIFVDDGEDHFRTLERDAVATALGEFDGVLALGGGAILAETTRAALAGHTVVYLSVELSDAVKRVGLGAGRPLLAINPRATLQVPARPAATALPEVATHTVITDGRTPEQVAEEIVQLLKP